jgi:phospholipid/cholesterol/gamma-HCH transport system ATP-binding protein
LEYFKGFEKQVIDKLKFTNLSFQYDAKTLLLDNVSLDFPRHENVHVVGESGVGKSVVLKLLAGLLLPKMGEYSVNEQSVSNMSFEEFLPYRKRIGYSFDYGGLLANRTIRDNLLLPLQYHGEITGAEADERVEVLLHRFKLHSYGDRRPAAVSGSVRKTAIIARSLVQNPELLILDDPFIGMDREGVIVLLNSIEDHRKFKNLKHVFFTSRGESVSAKLATQHLKIENSKLILDSTEVRKAAGL